jgi:hypothetical protein
MNYCIIWQFMSYFIYIAICEQIHMEIHELLHWDDEYSVVIQYF